jgi:hypothetical protein
LHLDEELTVLREHFLSLVCVATAAAEVAVVFSSDCAELADLLCLVAILLLLVPAFIAAGDMPTTPALPIVRRIRQ